MKIKLSPPVIGLVTGLFISLLFLYGYSERNTKLPVELIVIIVYASGIIGAIVSYLRSGEASGKFWDTFSPGLRSFIVTILALVAFTIIFNKVHPEFAVESAEMERTRITNEKSKTPAEIEQYVTDYKKGYLTALVSKTIFGYLIIGAVVTAITAAITTRRK